MFCRHSQDDSLHTERQNVLGSLHRPQRLLLCLLHGSGFSPQTWWSFWAGHGKMGMEQNCYHSPSCPLCVTYFIEKWKNTFPRKGLLLYPEAHDFPSLLCKIPSLLCKIIGICHIGPFSLDRKHTNCLTKISSEHCEQVRVRTSSPGLSYPKRLNFI